MKLKLEDLTPRQLSVLFIIRHLEVRHGTVNWNMIDNCFDGALMPSSESLDGALGVLERAGLVVVTGPVSTVVAAALTKRGRRIASEIELRRVFRRINVRTLRRLS